jgi:hypothetical protein
MAMQHWHGKICVLDMSQILLQIRLLCCMSLKQQV